VSGSSPDNRDMAVGRDQSLPLKEETISEILDRLKAWLAPPYREQSAVDLASLAVPLLDSTRVMGLGEFGRMVHAEMAAITDAAYRGVSTKDHLLICTTFPCQNCAKHLIAAGIRAVVYMEPYPKSLTHVIYPDEVKKTAMEPFENGQMGRLIEREAGRMLLCTFIGVAPRRYALFEPASKRKADGRVIKWDSKSAVPAWTNSVAPDWLGLERQFAESILPHLKSPSPTSPSPPRSSPHRPLQN
jgi:deoxycytidylate deaminase